MRDLRYALRSLSRSKGFVAVAVLSLALALGLNTSTFAILDAFMHPFDAYRDSDRLMKVGLSQVCCQGSYQNWYDAIRERTSFYEEIGGYSESIETVEMGDEVEELWVSRVTPNFFSLIGVKPERGRVLNSVDEEAVVVSHSFWLNRLGRPDSLDSTRLRVNGRIVSVVGVLPADMSYPTPFAVWQVNPQAAPRNPAIRRKPEISAADVALQMNRLGTQLMDESRRPDGRYGVVLKPYAASFLPNPYQLSQFHWALAGCAVLVLLIACANLANLMLARGIARRGELALRLAIGASRKALIQQLVTEAAILALAGGALGVFFAAWGVNLALATMPPIPALSLAPLHLSWRMFAFGLLSACVTVLLFGFLPAVRASDVDIAQPLKDNAGATTSRRSSRYSGLAMSQIGLALVLAMTATILGKSTYRFLNQEFDNRFVYNARWLTGATIDLRKANLPNAELSARFESIRERMRRVLGVTSAATVFYRALSQGHIAISDDERNDSFPRMLLRMYQEVSPEYFSTLGLGMREGRDFLPGDRDVAIVNPGAAMRLWHNRSPIGRLIKLGSPQSKAPWLPVVGVVEDHTDWRGDPDLGPIPAVYVVPAVDTAHIRAIRIRHDGTNPRVEAQIARQLQVTLSLPTVARVSGVGYYRYAGGVGASRKLTTGIFGLIALCGLALASVGLYGVLAHTVSRRMREFGVRIALGATDGQIYRLVLHDGTVIFLAGTALGAFAAMYAAQFISHLLFEVEFTDVWSLVISELVLCAAAFLACLAPARRAMRADPVEILRAT
ncbi:MAG: ABC transporter permease [Gemmatimonadetes bacterium]|nr:ABC transporter permease [Gemmatimonadota bacterium]